MGRGNLRGQSRCAVLPLVLEVSCNDALRALEGGPAAPILEGRFLIPIFQNRGKRFESRRGGVVILGLSCTSRVGPLEPDRAKILDSGHAALS